MTEPYKELANGIVLQAVKDYRAAGRKLKKKTRDGRPKRMAEGCEMFFRSEWFMALTEIDGPMLIRRIKEELP